MANWICEIYCLALDGFDLNTVHKLSSKEKNLSGVGIRTRGCWVVGRKNASSVLRSPPPPTKKIVGPIKCRSEEARMCLNKTHPNQGFFDRLCNNQCTSLYLTSRVT